MANSKFNLRECEPSGDSAEYLCIIDVSIVETWRIDKDQTPRGVARMGIHNDRLDFGGARL